MAEGVLERSVTMRALERRGWRLTQDRPARAIADHPDPQPILLARDPGRVQCLAVQVQRDRPIATGKRAREVKRQASHILGGPRKAPLAAIEHQVHSAGGQAPGLGLDCRPARAGRDSGTHRHEINLAHVFRSRQPALIQECEERRPVDARRTPPVPGTRLLVVGEVGMKRPQDLAHPPGLIDRDVVVGVSVQDVDAAGSEVADQGERVAGVTRACDELLDRTGLLALPGPGIGPHADPPRAGGGHGEPIGERHAQVPGSVSAHGMTGQVGPERICLELLPRAFQHLDRVEATPVFPVEAVGAPVRGRDQVQARFARIGFGLADRFHRRTVEGQHQTGPGWWRRGLRSRARLRTLLRTRGKQRVVLDAAVDRAAERPLARLVGLANAQFEACAIECFDW